MDKSNKDINSLIEKNWFLYESSIRNLCKYKFPNDICEQEDLTQKVFLAFIEKVKKGQSIYNPRAWLYKTARNLINNEYTSMHKLQLVFSLDSDSQFSSQLSVKPNYVDEQITSKQLGQYYISMLTSLSTKEKKLITDIYIHKYSIREIAKIQGEKTNTIEQRLIRLRRKVKKQIHI